MNGPRMTVEEVIRLAKILARVKGRYSRALAATAAARRAAQAAEDEHLEAVRKLNRAE